MRPPMYLLFFRDEPVVSMVVLSGNQLKSPEVEDQIWHHPHFSESGKYTVPARQGAHHAESFPAESKSPD